MKAIQLQEFGGADAFEYVDLEDPTPGEGEVLIEVTRAGVNFAATHSTRNDYLAEQLARPVDYMTETMGAPDAVGGVAIAILVATPEAIGAVRAALANRVQRSINIFLGSVLSTIALTIPAMIVISYLTGHPLILGVEHTDEWLLIVTLGVSIITFASGHANVMQGCVHLILFAAYILLIFQG